MVQPVVMLRCCCFGTASSDAVLLLPRVRAGSLPSGRWGGANGRVDVKWITGSDKWGREVGYGVCMGSKCTEARQGGTDRGREK